MRYFRASIACPSGNPLFELGEPCSFLAVKLFVADSDKTPEPWEEGPKKRLGLLAVCAAVTQTCRDFTGRRAKQASGGWGEDRMGPICPWGRNDVLLGGRRDEMKRNHADTKQVYESKVLSLESPVFIYTVEHLVTSWPQTHVYMEVFKLEPERVCA